MALPLFDTTEVVERAVPKLPAVRNGEESDSYPNVVARLGDDWRVIECKDRIQWIVQHRAGTRDARPRWEAKAYCRSRDGLMRRCREFVGSLGAEQLAKLPVHIEREHGA